MVVEGAATVFTIDKKLPPDKQRLFEIMLTRRADAFAAPQRSPVVAHGIEHEIHLNDPKPVASGPYRQSPAKQAVVEKEVERLLEQELITKSNSPWASPVSLVRKQNGDWRMVIDYRKVNAQTRKDAYPVPLIESCLQACKDANFLTLLDIKDAYHHIAVALESRKITAFITPQGLFEWQRMPFGLCNAPATFQRYVDACLRDFIGKFCAAFFDDCLVYTKGTVEDHIADVEKVLLRLRDSGLEVNAKKCSFGFEKVHFLGHIVGQGRIEPDPAKLDAISNFPTPTTVTELKSFLGLANYYRRFILGFASIAAPLYSMLRKGATFEWSQDRTAAVAQLKAALLKAPCLYAPDFTKPFVLQTDASGIGISGILSQKVNGELHPVGYASRLLNAAERNYSTSEQECLAVVWSIGQYEPFLIDAPFTIFTDHAALQYLAKGKLENKRLARWALTLQEYNYTIIHRPGKENANADALSRAPPVDTAPVDSATEHEAMAHGARHSQFARRTRIRQATEELRRQLRKQPARSREELARESEQEYVLAMATTVDPIEMERLTREQRSTERPDDREIAYITEYLSERKLPGSLTSYERQRIKTLAENYVLLDVEAPLKALHYYPAAPTRGLSALTPCVPRLVVPYTYREHLIALYHDSPLGGHVGIKRTIAHVAQRYFWSSLAADVAAHITACTTCQAVKLKRRQERRLVGHLPDPTEPFELVSIDLAGPLPTCDEFRYILIVVDHFTQFCISVPLANMESSTIARALTDEVFCKHGLPLRLLSDRGTPFLNTLIHDLGRLLRIRIHHTSSYHPQADGKTERLVGTVKRIITAVLDDKTYKERWVDALQPATFAYNATVSNATGFSPFYLTHGRFANIPGDELAHAGDDDAVSPEYYASVLAKTLADSKTFVQHLKETMRTKQKEEESKTLLAFHEGDAVLLHDGRQDTRLGKQLRTFARLFLGPYEVVKRLGEYVYLIRPYGAKRGKAAAGLTVHGSRLKAFHGELPARGPPLPHNEVVSVLPITASVADAAPPAAAAAPLNDTTAAAVAPAAPAAPTATDAATHAAAPTIAVDRNTPAGPDARAAARARHDTQGRRWYGYDTTRFLPSAERPEFRYSLPRRVPDTKQLSLTFPPKT